MGRRSGAVKHDLQWQARGRTFGVQSLRCCDLLTWERRVGGDGRAGGAAVALAETRNYSCLFFVCGSILACSCEVLQWSDMSLHFEKPICHALVPCAGTGSRAGTALPKQYQMVGDKPLVMHTLLALAKVPSLVSAWVILSPDDSFVWPESQWPSHFRREACGGVSRAHSVFNGLSAMLQAGLSAQDWVLVHDAARCLITADLVSQLIQVCQNDSVGGLLALPLPDSLKAQTQESQTARVKNSVSREDKWLAQTPQMFQIGPLHSALKKASATDFEGITDESSAMEQLGLSPLLVHGSAQNLKVTYPADFAFAEMVLKGRT